MTIATLIGKLQEDISWLGYNATEREIIEHIKCAITLLKEQESLAKAVDQEHPVNEYLHKQLAERPEIVRCEKCKWNKSTEHNPICEKYYGA